MNSGSTLFKPEIERMLRVSDQLCTAHALLRDQFSRRQFVIDTAILLLSSWITAMGFADPRFSQWLVPRHLDSQLWIGTLGSAAFALTLVQFKADWRGRSEAHQRSFTIYSEIKREAGQLLASVDEIPARDFQRLADRYHIASDVGTGIPEKLFLSLKRHHKLKIAVSRKLDEQPGSSPWLTKIKLILRDNWN
jgi:hypothetical protein